MKGLPEILGRDSEGVAAKGAAEFAKRIPYNPYRIQRNPLSLAIVK